MLFVRKRRILLIFLIMITVLLLSLLALLVPQAYAGLRCPSDDFCAGTPHVSIGYCNATDGVCSITQCEAGYGDCDRVWSNGCEVETAANIDHCGQCGLQCYRDAFNSTMPPGTLSLACFAGICHPGTCRPYLERCPDDDPRLGCRVSRIDPYTCGGCLGVNCYSTRAPGVAVYICSPNAECLIQSCFPGFYDCDGQGANGCEASFPCCPPDCPANFRCNFETNACEPNCTGTECCGGAMMLENCGECGYDCLAHANASIHIHVSQWECVKSRCAASYCDSPLWRICNVRDTSCTNTNTDPRNCGYCNYICGVGLGFLPAAEAHVLEWGCEDGECGPRQCEPGWMNCDSQAWNGCEMFGISCRAPNPTRPSSEIEGFHATVTAAAAPAPAIASTATILDMDITPEASTKSAHRSRELVNAIGILMFVQRAWM